MLSCCPKSWQLLTMAGKMNASSCKQCPSTQYLLQSTCRENAGNGTQLYCCGATPAAERRAITDSWRSWLISSADSWHCSGSSVGSSIPSVCLPDPCNIFRASSHCNDTVFGFMESVVLRKPLTKVGFQTRISDELHYHIVPEMVSRLSGFRALASCDCCKRGSVRLLLQCRLSGVVELFLNWNPSPWDMRILEIEVWMSVQFFIMKVGDLWSVKDKTKRRYCKTFLLFFKVKGFSGSIISCFTLE